MAEDICPFPQLRVAAPVVHGEEVVEHVVVDICVIPRGECFLDALHHRMLCRELAFIVVGIVDEEFGHPHLLSRLFRHRLDERPVVGAVEVVAPDIDIVERVLEGDEFVVVFMLVPSEALGTHDLARRVHLRSCSLAHGSHLRR